MHEAVLEVLPGHVHLGVDGNGGSQDGIELRVLLRAQVGLHQIALPDIGGVVHQAEIRAEVPDRGAEAGGIHAPRQVGGIQGAGQGIHPVIRAELSHEDRPPVLRGPGADEIQVLIEDGPLGGRGAPWGAHPGLGAFHEGRALVGEGMRFVVMDRDDEVTVGGKPQDAETAVTAPGRGAHHQGPTRLRNPDGVDGFFEEIVPGRRVQFFPGLVEQFEQQLGSMVAEALADLLPHGQKARALFLRLYHNGVVMVHIQHHHQLGFQGLVHGPGHPLHEGGVDRVRALGAGMCGEARRDAHHGETGVGDPTEVLGLEGHPPGPFRGGVQGIAQIDTLAQPGVQGLGRGEVPLERGRLGSGAAAVAAADCDKDDRSGEKDGNGGKKRKIHET